jgi:hypothetical protein
MASDPTAPQEALIERLRAAEVGSRELDALVDDYLLERGLRVIRISPGTPPWSTSVDAALSLVPEGQCVLLAVTPHRAVCDVHTRPLGDPAGFWPAHAEAATAPLAIVIAALSARGSA